ncbi:MAG: DeoR family transcriptional regulator [Patescibacteria group bacterium]
MLPDFAKKAYEICYAVFRLGDAIKNDDLRIRLESAGLDLLEASSLSDNSPLSRSLSRLEVLILFSQGIGKISYIQSQILLREIGNFNTAIRQNNSAIAELNLEEFFQAPLHQNTEPKTQPAMPMVVDNKINVSAENDQAETVIEEKDKENLAMRQSAVMDIMRQVKNCRIKDLIAAFPGVSERTLRYDLQKFCEEGIIERVGLGGPGTYYQLKPSVTSS